jgi:hypothetical protein
LMPSTSRRWRSRRTLQMAVHLPSTDAALLKIKGAEAPFLLRESGVLR